MEERIDNVDRWEWRCLRAEMLQIEEEGKRRGARLAEIQDRMAAKYGLTPLDNVDLDTGVIRRGAVLSVAREG